MTEQLNVNCWRPGMVLLGLALLLDLSCATVSCGSTNEIGNAGFEETANALLTQWKAVGRGCALDDQTVHSGKRAIRCESTNSTETWGVAQVLSYEQPDKRPIIVGGWSKAQAVGTGGDYCVYLDIIYDDGTPWWGKTSAWARGTHDWQYAAQVYLPQKPVREIRTYVFLRRTTGKAWFDDVFVHRGGLHATAARVLSDFPRTREGQQVRGKLTLDADWRCTLFDPSGRELDSCSGRGKAISWNWPGRPGANPATVGITARTTRAETLELRIPAAEATTRPTNPVRTGYAVWWRNAMCKIYPTEFPPPESGGEPTVSLARNEREGLQIAITPADAVLLRNVQVSFSEFRSERGELLPADAVKTHVVGYVYVDTPSGHPNAPGQANWCPEVLLPARPFDVPGGRTQTVWVTFHASDAVGAGTYRGRILVRPEGAPAVELPVSVRVRNFGLPPTPRMKTAFAIMDGFTRATYGQITPELRRRCLDLMLEHRLNPDDISRTDPPALEDLLYARQRGLNAFNVLNLVPKPKGEPRWVCYVPLEAYRPDFTDELAARLDPYVETLRKHGLSRMAYFYGFDERRSEYDELIRHICKFLKQRYPEISTFTTAGYMYQKRRDAPAGDQDYMDWYCPLTPKYDRDLSRQLRVQGKQVWWYVCCGPRYPYANFASMDYPSIEGRLLGWMTFGFESDGLLYWHVNSWYPNAIIAGDDPYLDWTPGCLWGMTGDGCLTYPTRDGPVASIRLANIRDGLEDYDYLAMLADAKGRDAAQQYVDRLVKSLTDFNRDPAALDKVRAEIADTLEAAK